MKLHQAWCVLGHLVHDLDHLREYKRSRVQSQPHPVLEVLCNHIRDTLNTRCLILEGDAAAQG